MKAINNIGIELQMRNYSHTQSWDIIIHPCFIANIVFGNNIGNNPMVVWQDVNTLAPIKIMLCDFARFGWKEEYLDRVRHITMIYCVVLEYWQRVARLGTRFSLNNRSYISHVTVWYKAFSLQNCLTSIASYSLHCEDLDTVWTLRLVSANVSE